MGSELDGKHVSRVLDGETEVFRHLVREHQEMAYSIAFSMVKNDVDTKDIVQNAFIQAYKALKSFKGDAKFSTWLYKIVVNESLQFIRKNKKWGSYTAIEDDHQEYGSAFNDAIVIIDLGEKRAAIQKALEDMKPKEALVLKLHYLHEYALREMEDITGFSKSNIKILLYRARKSFMKIYLENN